MRTFFSFVLLFSILTVSATVYTTTGVDTWDANGAPPAGWLGGHTINISHSITNAGYTAQLDAGTTLNILSGGSWSILAVSTNNSPTINITGTLTTSTSFSLGTATMTINSGGLLDIGTSFQQDGGGSTTINTGGRMKTATTGSTTAGTFVLNGQAMFAGALTNNIAITGTGILGYGSIGGTGSVAGGITLPIELISFSAVKSNNAVNIQWTTASEINSAYFEVLRADDSKQFVVISKILAAGNSTNQLNYLYTDETPTQGVNYYKLREVDFDGASQESQIAATLFEEEVSVNIFPNPSNQQAAVVFTLNKSQACTITVFNAEGKNVYSSTFNGVDGENILTLSLENLPAGLYQINLMSGNSQITSTTFVKN